MKRLLTLLLIIILAKTIAFSSTTLVETEQDSIVYITSNDLKYANVIFAEHSKFIEENDLLRAQIDNYKYLNKALMETDSLRLCQIQEYNSLDQTRLKQITDLENKINSKNKAIKYWQIGGISVSIGLLLFIIFK